MSTWRVRRAVAGTLALLAVGVAATGCGSASEPSPPSGVDELLIPTPSPDPDDFVTGVDNPWFPLEPGTVLEYDVDGSEGSGTVTVTVGEKTQLIAGVTTTPVTTTPDTSGDAVVHTDYYAQDRDGNVWWFGRAGEWEAGDDGARAGLAMPAVPREGDGFRLALEPGVVEDKAEVEDVDATLDEPAADLVHLVVLDVSSELTPGVVERRFYARGTGLVYAENVEGPAMSTMLTRGPDEQS